MQQNQDNPYAAPGAVVNDVGTADAELAGRGARLGAVIIDFLIIFVIMMPLMLFFGYFSGMMRGEQPGILAQLTWSLAGMILFLAIQYVPLNNSGQTWGKKALSIKIVDLDGNKPDIMTLLLKRYALIQWLPSFVPFLGGLFNLVNVLFIFRGDKRCIHDLVAGTRVVKV